MRHSLEEALTTVCLAYHLNKTPRSIVASLHALKDRVHPAHRPLLLKIARCSDPVKWITEYEKSLESSNA